ncbi:MAG: hypothetical protein WAX04_14625 [Oscillospiraceae bacterium]
MIPHKLQRETILIQEPREVTLDNNKITDDSILFYHCCSQKEKAQTNKFSHTKTRCDPSILFEKKRGSRVLKGRNQRNWFLTL